MVKSCIILRSLSLNRRYLSLKRSMSSFSSSDTCRHCKRNQKVMKWNGLKTGMEASLSSQASQAGELMTRQVQSHRRSPQGKRSGVISNLVVICQLILRLSSARHKGCINKLLNWENSLKWARVRSCLSNKRKLKKKPLKVNNSRWNLLRSRTRLKRIRSNWDRSWIMIICRLLRSAESWVVVIAQPQPFSSAPMATAIQKKRRAKTTNLTSVTKLIC